MISCQSHAIVVFRRFELTQAQFISTDYRERQYLDIFRWNGVTWDEVTDSYSIASDVHGSDAIGPLPVEGPQPSTTLVTTKATPLVRQSFDQGSLPDVIAIEMSYFLGPGSILHTSPTLVILVPTPDGFRYGYAETFGVRAGIDTLYRLANDIYVTLPAYLDQDAACCPRGTEFVRLAWRNGLFIKAEDCVRPQRVTSCS